MAMSTGGFKPGELAGRSTGTDILSGVPGARSRLHLRVAPGGRRSTVVGRYGEAWKVRVAAAPERGRANDEVITVIAEALAISRSAVRLVAGASSRDKIVELEGIEAAEAERRLQRAANHTESSAADVGRS